MLHLLVSSQLKAQRRSRVGDEELSSPSSLRSSVPGFSVPSDSSRVKITTLNTVFVQIHLHFITDQICSFSWTQKGQKLKFTGWCTCSNNVRNLSSPAGMCSCLYAASLGWKMFATMLLSITNKLCWNDSDNKISCGSVSVFKLFPHISISNSEVMVLPEEIKYEKMIHAWYNKTSLNKQQKWLTLTW